jgi:GDP-L-fucose synthase
MERSSRIYIAGHCGLVGSALARRCRALGFNNLILPPRKDLDLCDQQAVNAFFASARPEYVFLAAGRVGGIHANNSRPADFIRDNLLIAANVIDAAWRGGVRKLLFLGSSCIYPKLAPQPLREEYLLTGALEPTNEWYAMAKLAGLKMGQAHLAPARFRRHHRAADQPPRPWRQLRSRDLARAARVIRKIGDAQSAGAQSVSLWGTGAPRREFLYVDDLADACVFLQNYRRLEPINVGCGEDLTIRELATKIAHVVGFRGRFDFDSTRPDGTPRKVLDVSRLTALGWRARTDLDTGLEATWAWYRRRQELRAGTTHGVARFAEA